MSAFIVSTETMQRVVSALVTLPENVEAGNKLGHDLFAMNCEAIRQRYAGQRGLTDDQIRQQ